MYTYRYILSDMHICIYEYIHKCVCMHTCIDTWFYGDICILIYTFVLIKYLYLNGWIFIHVCANVYEKYICIYSCVHVFTFLCMYNCLFIYAWSWIIVHMHIFAYMYKSNLHLRVHLCRYIFISISFSGQFVLNFVSELLIRPLLMVPW